MFLEASTAWMSDLALQLHQWFRHSLPSMMEIETVSDDQRNLVSVRGDLLSVLRIDGMRYLPTGDEIRGIADAIRTDLKSLMETGHRSIQFLFLCDPARTPIDVARHIAAVRNFGDAMALNITPLLSERQALWSARMCVEETYVALWTRRSVFNASEKTLDAMALSARRDALPPARMAQKWWLSSPLLAARHEGFVAQFRQSLSRHGVRSSRPNPHDALKAMREVFDVATIGSAWRPRLPSDPLCPRRPDRDARQDISHLLAPPLAEQFFSSEACHARFSQVDMGPHRYASVDMTLAPEIIHPFMRFFEGMRRPPEPFRISFLIDGGGGRWMAQRLVLAQILSSLSSTNKRIATALEKLQAMRDAGESFVRFRCSATTWGRTSHPDIVHDRVAKLRSAIESWGAAQTSSVAGDPVEAMMSSALGLHATSTAPAADGPLSDVLVMMPWTRAGSPWKSGALLYMTPEGRPYPYDPVGSKRTAVVEIIIGRPGTGKSMLLNTASVGLVLSAASTTGPTPNLPFVRTVDIGPSSRGVIDLLRQALPPEMAQLVLHARFQNAADYAYNIFDTQPGCQRPLPDELDSIVNIIAETCTPESGQPYESMSSLIKLVVRQAYRFRSQDDPNGQPRVYQRDIEPRIDDALGSHHVTLRPRATWWDVVDALFDCGETNLMTLAQRHAVPLLEDLVEAVHDPTIYDMYHKVPANDGESMVELFIRLIQEMIHDLPVLSQTTKFDFGEARVVALDMEEVCRGGGAQSHKQTQIMYLVALYILAKDFMLHEDQIGYFPEQFRPYNLRRIVEFSTTVKRLNADEIHVTNGCAQVRNQIDLLSRITRKKMFHLALASHHVQDFPPEIAKLATGIYITGLGKGDAADEVADRFGLCAASRQILHSRLNGPHLLNETVHTYAAPFLAVWRLDEDGNNTEQMLYNLIGPVETWALSTRPDDVHLRDRLYRELGHREAWRRLAQVFPNGTARDEVERRANILAETGRNRNDAKSAVIGSLVAEIVDGHGVALGLRGSALETPHQAPVINGVDMA